MNNAPRQPPPYPPGPYPPVPSPSGPADPGPLPLRPLAVGDLLGGGFALVWRHLRALAPLAVLIAMISAATELAILAGTGSLELFASGEWIEAWQRGVDQGRVDALPTGLYVAVGAGSIISMVGVFALSGAAAACAAADAVSRSVSGAAVRARLLPALPRLVGVALLVAVAVAFGSLLFLAPGLLILAHWALAGPITTLERASARHPLLRSTRLTRGHRWRIVGVVLLIVVITVLIDTVLSSLVTPAAAALGLELSAASALVLSDAIGAIVAGITTSWVGAVIALLYVDIRIRDENLAPALRAAAAARP